MSSYHADHTFDEGLNSDLPTLRTPATVATALHNMHRLASGREGEQQITQTDRGNQYVAGLPAGWVVMGSEQFAGVRYFALAEVAENGTATGRGQLGSFPAPAPDGGSSGPLVPRYRPLQNYTLNGGLSYGDFVSAGFAFSLEHPVQVEIQPDYDGTVNLILNDALNPPLLFNSRFAVLDDGRYRIVDRDGDRDTNLYNLRSFTDSALLFQRSRSLVRMEFEGLLDGGQVAGGLWTYYGCYVSQDTQATDVVAWSPNIPVYDGVSMPTIHGTLGPTNQRVRLRISGLDTAYQFFRIIAVRVQGLGGAEAVECVQITPDQRLSADELTFTHTGYEQTQPYDADLLSVRQARIARFAAMTQAENMLVFVGATEGVYDDAACRDFAQQVRVGCREQNIAVNGAANDGATAGAGSQSPLAAFDAAATQGDGRAGGYLNPWNAAYRLGYPSGEALPFALVLRLKDGSDSHPFPLRGHDHLLADQAYTGDPAELDGRGWAASGENTDGVYRFPLLTAAGRQPLLSADGRYVRALGVTFELPEIPPALRALAVGCYFVRAARNPDRLAQGYVVPVVNSLLTPPNGFDPFDHQDNAFTPIYASNNGRTHSQLKVLPAIAATLETSVKKWDRTENQGRWVGAFPFTFCRKLYNQKYLMNPWRLAFYSADTAANPLAYQSRLSSATLRMSQQGFVRGRGVEFGWHNGPNGGSFALWKTTGVATGHNMGQRQVTSHWTEGGSWGTNDGRFGSAEAFLVGKHAPNSATDDRYLTQSVWDTYVGLETNDFLDGNEFVALTNNMTAGGADRGTGQEIASFVQSAVQTERDIAWLVNLYPRHSSDDALAAATQGARPRDVLRDLYSIDNQGYFPITPVLTWDELEGALDGNRRFLAFGGDTYVTNSYRRITRAVPSASEREPGWGDAPICTLLGMVCESECHPFAGRLPEVQARPGEDAPRSFFPNTLQAVGLDWNQVRGNASKAPETTAFNAGLAWHKGHTDQLALPRNLPFRAVDYPNQVAVTGTHIVGGFQNGYRRFQTGAERTYHRELGSMRGVRALGRMLVIGLEKGVIALEVNERTEAGANAAGSVYLEVQNILSPVARPLSTRYGVLSQQALLATDQTVYGIGAEGVWWLRGGEFQRGSSQHVDVLLLPVLSRVGRGTSLLMREARLSYDAGRGDVVVSVAVNRYAPGPAAVLLPPDPYYQPAPGRQPPGEAEPLPGSLPEPPVTVNPMRYAYGDADFVQLLYSQVLNQWVATSGWRGQHAFAIGDKFYSVPLPGLGARARAGLFLHEGNHGYYYDAPQESYVEFIVRGDGSKTQKILDNLMLVSNEVLPTRIVYTPDGAPATVQPLVTGGIVERNAEYEEGHAYVTVQQRGQGPRQRGKVIRVRLVYPARQRVLLESVVATVKNSFS